MIIKHDYSYLDLFSEKELIEKGFAELDIHSLNFSKHFTEEIRANNRKLADTLSKEEWEKHCGESHKKTEEHLIEIVKILGEKYIMYGYNEDNYRSDWDLFLSMRTSMMQIPFNKNRTIEQNMKLLNEILELVEQIDDNHIECRVQYTARRDEEKIEDTANSICEELLEKPIEYKGMEGKIKVVDEHKGIKTYGFFKKRARKKYYQISKEYLVLKHA